MLFAQNIFEHVLDSKHWHISESLHWGWHLPEPLTKYVVLMLLAAVLILLVYVPLGQKIKSGEAPRGLFWNAMEGLLTFIRDNVAKPYIPHHTDHYVPYLWTTFLFILVCNLFGMIPAMGSPTASISVTAAFALATYLYIQGSAIHELGFVHYLESIVPNLDMPLGLKIPMLMLLYPLEIAGNLIRASVLAIRLFANMFAGHLVLATLLTFIVMLRNQHDLLFWPISFTAAFGVTAMSLLELFVAFLQAFIFTFLTALFLGAAVHPEH